MKDQKRVCSNPIFQLPHEDLSSLPPLDVPPGFDEKQCLAVEATKKEVQMLKKQQLKAEDEEDEDGSDSSDGYISDGFGDILHKNPVDEAAPYLPFIDALPNCTVLTLGFHAIFNEKWCYSPCGRHMKTWRAINGLVIPEEDMCEKGGKREPFALLKHLKDKSQSFYHHIIRIYLFELYRNYMCDGLDHKALYDVNTTGYKDAVKMEKKEIFRYVVMFSTTLFCLALADSVTPPDMLSNSRCN